MVRPCCLGHCRVQAGDKYHSTTWQQQVNLGNLILRNTELMCMMLLWNMWKPSNMNMMQLPETLPVMKLLKPHGLKSINAKVFLSRYASRSFQKDYEDTVTPTERTNLKFKDLVKKMKTRYEPTRNYTLANYDFHHMKQNTDESFDTYVHRVKQEAKGCQFSCESPTCTIPDIMVRDQVIVGMNDDENRKNALKNQ